MIPTTGGIVEISIGASAVPFWTAISNQKRPERQEKVVEGRTRVGVIGKGHEEKDFRGKRFDRRLFASACVSKQRADRSFGYRI